ESTVTVKREGKIFTVTYNGSKNCSVMLMNEKIHHADCDEWKQENSNGMLCFKGSRTVICEVE
ncbi:MAG: hypothetical protein ACI4DK_14100, partial [Lachnospiraceae bacterium]